MTLWLIGFGVTVGHIIWNLTFHTSATLREAK
jgi:hypothetical protein